MERWQMTLSLAVVAIGGALIAPELVRTEAQPVAQPLEPSEAPPPAAASPRAEPPTSAIIPEASGAGAVPVRPPAAPVVPETFWEDVPDCGMG